MSSKQINWILLLVLIAVVLVYTLSGGSVDISLDFGEDAVAVSASNYDWTVPYDQIDSIELTSLPDTGKMLEGISKRSLRCGTWENEVWGKYTLCIRPNIDRCIVLTLRGGEVFVVNYESNNTTESLAKMVTDLLTSKGYLNHQANEKHQLA